MALRGVRVIELAGVAPAPFCGMVLADFGACVTRVDKTGGRGIYEGIDCLANGKKSIALNLKNPKGAEILRGMCKESDVLIESFRKGVMEKLGLGPSILLADNPRLIYARLTAFGQSGPNCNLGAHDINCVATSGLLSLMGRKNENPIPTLNLGGSGIMCALGITMALLDRYKSGQGQIIDSSMVESAAYLGSWQFRSQHLPIWGGPRGHNMLDTGTHFYETYKTKEGKFMAVGSLEPQFYSKLLEGLEYSEKELPQYGDFEEKKRKLAEKFEERTQEEWCKVFDNTDACVSPVLSLDEAAKYPHNSERQSFTIFADSPIMVPKPAPHLSRTPATSLAPQPSPAIGQHSSKILSTLNYSKQDIQQLEEEGVVKCA